MTGMTKGVVPPRLGEEIRFTCRKCGCSFKAKKSLLPVKCPECGSLQTGKDFRFKN